MPVVLMAALRKAGTSVCQPIDRFELELPAQAHQPVAALLGRLDWSSSTSPHRLGTPRSPATCRQPGCPISPHGYRTSPAAREC